METAAAIKESLSYRFVVENNNATPHNVVLFDTRKRRDANFGNPLGITVNYAFSDYSYAAFLAYVISLDLQVNRVGVYVDKEPVSIFYRKTTKIGTIYQSPISNGFIYPNEKVYLDVDLEFSYRDTSAEALALIAEGEGSCIVVDSMPPNSKLWIELFPASIIKRGNSPDVKNVD